MPAVGVSAPGSNLSTVQSEQFLSQILCSTILMCERLQKVVNLHYLLSFISVYQPKHQKRQKKTNPNQLHPLTQENYSNTLTVMFLEIAVETINNNEYQYPR